MKALYSPKVKKIGYKAFFNALLKTLYLPEATTIGTQAFEKSPITHLTLPIVNYLGDNAFKTIVNRPSTHVIIPLKFQTNAEKDRIFGVGPNGESH